MEAAGRPAYPSDVTDEEWSFVAPYLTLMREDAPQRDHPLREVFNGARWIVRAGASWRMMPHDLPPWHTVYQQTQRWIAAEVFEVIAQDLRMLLREIAGRDPQPSAGSIDSQSVKTAAKGGTAAMTLARRLRGASATLSSIPWD